MFKHFPKDVNNYSKRGTAEDRSREGEKNEIVRKGRMGKSKRERAAVSDDK